MFFAEGGTSARKTDLPHEIVCVFASNAMPVVVFSIVGHRIPQRNGPSLRAGTMRMPPAVSFAAPYTRVAGVRMFFRGGGHRLSLPRGGISPDFLIGCPQLRDAAEFPSGRLRTEKRVGGNECRSTEYNGVSVRTEWPGRNQTASPLRNRMRRWEGVMSLLM